jgi:hypothetical protein
MPSGEIWGGNGPPPLAGALIGLTTARNPPCLVLVRYLPLFVKSPAVYHGAALEGYIRYIYIYTGC